MVNNTENIPEESILRYQRKEPFALRSGADTRAEDRLVVCVKHCHCFNEFDQSGHARIRASDRAPPHVM